MLRKTKAIWDSNHPWSIKTFLEFAAVEGILLDLVILGYLENGGGEEDGSLFQTMIHDMTFDIYCEFDRHEMHCM